MDNPDYVEAGTSKFELLRQLWDAGVVAVSGQRAVAEALKQDGPFSADLIIAVGKAACSMFLGAKPCISAATRSIVVSKYGHIDPACRGYAATEIIEAGHPVPDANSLHAGETILHAVRHAGSQDQLLLLVSGGASALAEVLQTGCDSLDLEAITGTLLGSGKTIAEINAIRRGMSLIKGGKLLGEFRGKSARVYALSDVQGDGLATIGSGIGQPGSASVEVLARVVASNSVARDAAASEAGRLGLAVKFNEESLYKDVSALALEISERLLGGNSGVYIWGGEPTIELPRNPGSGGRNQSLALAIATHIKGKNGISVLVAGTDGTDGPTDYAGAFVDGDTVGDAEVDSDEAESALRKADAGSYLGKRQRLFKSGPTNTNVMDLVIATIA